MVCAGKGSCISSNVGHRDMEGQDGLEPISQTLAFTGLFRRASSVASP